MDNQKIVNYSVLLLILGMILPIGFSLFSQSLVIKGSTTITRPDYKVFFVFPMTFDTESPTNYTIDFGPTNLLRGIETDTECTLNGTYYGEDTDIPIEDWSFPVYIELSSNQSSVNIIFFMYCAEGNRIYIPESGMGLAYICSNETSFYWTAENLTQIESYMHYDAEHEMETFDWNTEHLSTLVSIGSQASITHYDNALMLTFMDSADYVEFDINVYNKIVVPDSESPYADYLILIPIGLIIGILMYFIPKKGGWINE